MFWLTSEKGFQPSTKAEVEYYIIVVVVRNYIKWNESPKLTLIFLKYRGRYSLDNTCQSYRPHPWLTSKVPVPVIPLPTTHRAAKKPHLEGQGVVEQGHRPGVEEPAHRRCSLQCHCRAGEHSLTLSERGKTEAASVHSKLAYNSDWWVSFILREGTWGKVWFIGNMSSERRKCQIKFWMCGSEEGRCSILPLEARHFKQVPAAIARVTG